MIVYNFIIRTCRTDCSASSPMFSVRNSELCEKLHLESSDHLKIDTFLFHGFHLAMSKAHWVHIVVLRKGNIDGTGFHCGVSSLKSSSGLVNKTQVECDFRRYLALRDQSLTNKFLHQIFGKLFRLRPNVHFTVKSITPKTFLLRSYDPCYFANGLAALSLHTFFSQIQS